MHLIQSASSLPADASALESCISALERDIKALENSSVPWEHRLPWFTALVAVGIAMEFWVIWRERRDDMEDWGRGIIRPPQRPSIAKFVIEVFSLVLVTGGIVGELWAGIAITSINGKLRTESAELRNKSDQLLALVTQQAGGASKSAELAGHEAAGATADAKSANASSLQAKQRATEVGNNLAKEIEREQAAERQLEDEKVKRLRLAASLLPRQIFDSTGIANQLLSIAPRRVVLAYLDESEPRDLTEQLAGVCFLLHWPFSRRPIQEDAGFPDGVSISFGQNIPKGLTGDEEDRAIRDSRANEKIPETVANVLTRHGVDAAFSFFPAVASSEPTNTLVIEIGRKSDKEAREALQELSPPPKPTPFTGPGTIKGGIGTFRIGINSIPLESPSEIAPKP